MSSGGCWEVGRGQNAFYGVYFKHGAGNSLQALSLQTWCDRVQYTLGIHHCKILHSGGGRRGQTPFNRLQCGGNPIEILYNELDDGRVQVFHAMPCRSMFITLLNEQEKL